MEARKQKRLFSHLIDLRHHPDNTTAVESDVPEQGTGAPSTGAERPYENPDGRADGMPDSKTASTAVSSHGHYLEMLEKDFIWIPAGRFVMGSHAHEPGHEEDESDHEVTLSRGFYLQRVSVTQGLWQAVMDSNPSNFTAAGPDLPVEGVSWQDCHNFMDKLKKVTGFRHRLPTEAEWEYACRAGSVSAFANGRITKQYCELDPVLDEIGWYCGNSGRSPHPVGAKTLNNWGLFDMHGNVWEWCEDWHGAYDVSPQVDPSGPRSGTEKVVRGGSWFSNARNCRSAARFCWEPGIGSDMIGFRLVRCTEQFG